MVERCRVFSKDGEELFPCRWAKAKKLVKANIAKKIYVDGKMCIQILKSKGENKMENKELKDTVEFVSSGNILTRACPDCGHLAVLSENGGKCNNCGYIEFPKELYTVNVIGYLQNKVEPVGIICLKFNQKIDNNSAKYITREEGEDRERFISAKSICLMWFGRELSLAELFEKKAYSFHGLDYGFPIRTMKSLSEEDLRFYKQQRVVELQKELEEAKLKIAESESLTQQKETEFPKELYAADVKWNFIEDLKFNHKIDNQLAVYIGEEDGEEYEVNVYNDKICLMYYGKELSLAELFNKKECDLKDLECDDFLYRTTRSLAEEDLKFYKQQKVIELQKDIKMKERAVLAITYNQLAEVLGLKENSIRKIYEKDLNKEVLCVLHDDPNYTSKYHDDSQILEKKFDKNEMLDINKEIGCLAKSISAGLKVSHSSMVEYLFGYKLYECQKMMIDSCFLGWSDSVCWERQISGASTCAMFEALYLAMFYGKTIVFVNNCLYEQEGTIKKISCFLNDKRINHCFSYENKIEFSNSKGTIIFITQPKLDTIKGITVDKIIGDNLTDIFINSKELESYKVRLYKTTD